jgi:hypothetical protein
MERRLVARLTLSVGAIDLAGTTAWDSNLANSGQGIEGARVAPGFAPLSAASQEGRDRIEQNKSLQ